MFDRLIRYLPALDYIRRHHPQKILEVGSGAKGIGEFFNQKFTGVDLALEENPVHNMTFVQSSASKLPFHDGEFDLVVCMDVLEHLPASGLSRRRWQAGVPEKEREKVVGEMMRVTFGKNKSEKRKAKSENPSQKSSRRAVIIGYPCGKEAAKLSKKMLRWFQKRGSGTARWMREHVENGLPDSKLKIIRQRRISLWRKNSKLKIQEFNNENLFICQLLLRLEENGRFLKLERLLYARFPEAMKFFLRRVNFGKCYRKIWVITACDLKTTSKQANNLLSERRRDR